MPDLMTKVACVAARAAARSEFQAFSKFDTQLSAGRGEMDVLPPAVGVIGRKARDTFRLVAPARSVQDAVKEKIAPWQVKRQNADPRLFSDGWIGRKRARQRALQTPRTRTLRG